MSNFINLAMQNRDIEEMKKKRQKAEIEDALLGGGGSMGGSSESSDSSSSSDFTMPKYNTTSENIGSVGSGSLASLLGDVVADYALDAALDYGQGKFEDFIEGKFKEKFGKEAGEKVAKEVGEKATKEVGEKVAKEVGEKATKEVGEKAAKEVGEKATKEVGEKVVKEVGEKVTKEVGEKAIKGVEKKITKKLTGKLGKKISKKIAGKAGKYALGLAGGPGGWAADAAFFVYDVVDIAVLATTGKDINEHLGISQWFKDKWDGIKDKTEDLLYKGDKEEFKEREKAINEKTMSMQEEQLLRQSNLIFGKKQDNSEDKKKKEMEEAEKAKKAAEEKLKKEKATKQASNNKDNNNEDDEEDGDEDDKNNNSGNSSVKKGLKKSLTHTVGTFGGTLAISTSTIGVYRIHYTGEFEYKGITGEYQNASHTFQNLTSYDENGDVVLNGLSKENKLLKTFYTKYSDKSYYAIVEDSKKYKNIDDAYLRKNLLTPDELREQYPDISDVNNREVMFQLNPDVLYVLDKYIHEDKVLYPQQFVKPVYYEESQENFGLKDLINEKGVIVAKSQEFDSNGKPLKNTDGSFKTTAGIWDYGFASVLRYKEYEVQLREVTAPVKREAEKMLTGMPSVEIKVESEEVKEAPVSGSIPGGGVEKKDKGMREKPAYIIDAAVTPGGTITNKVKQDWQRAEGAAKESTKISYQTVETGETKLVCNPLSGGNSESKPEEGATSGKTEGKSIELLSKNKETEDKEANADSNENKSCIVMKTYDVYKITDTYETYMEEYLPQYDGEPSSEEITGSKYFRDYMTSYSNYYPSDLPNKIDFSVLNNEELQKLIYDDTGDFVAQENINSAQAITKEEFDKAVFMGDSITVGLDVSSTIPSDRVYAEGSLTVGNGDKKFSDKLIAAKPSVIVISYGTNDAGADKTDTFVKDYKALITKLKEGIPGVKIYLNKIFPGNESLAKTAGEKKILKNIPSYNTALSSIALETGVTLIDCTNILNLNTYYSDAFHFKSNFYPLWKSEMEKKIVGSTSTVQTVSVLNNVEQSLEYSNPLLKTLSNMRTGLVLPPATTGEERNVMDVLKVGSKKDSEEVVGAMQHKELCETIGPEYGIDPYILLSKIAGESGGDTRKDGAARGVMQIEKSVFLGKTVKAWNVKNGTYDEVKISKEGEELYNAKINIQVGAMILANAMADAEYNILAGLQGYNFGTGGLYATIRYYLGSGNYDTTTFSTQNVKDYLKMNHSGWITAQYPGDKDIEKSYPESRADGGATDLKHSARMWYSNEGWRLINADGHGTPVVIERDLAHYAGDGSPWIMNKEGQVITLDGAASSMGTSSGGTPLTMFNQYLKSNWSAITEKWDELFPGQSELDKKLDIVKKGDYTELYENYESIGKVGAKSIAITLPRSSNADVARMNEVDKQLTLNMMFALNQGNYLFKYDEMSEAEWKAMYTQLLASPTGQEWDDGWIGFTVEEIFGVKDMESLGTLFPDDIGVSPTISVPYGMNKNNISGDETKLTQYNAMNFGIDIVVPPDTDVLTVADGTVIGISKKNDNNSRYGNYVKIQHAKGTITLTANLKTVKVKVGDTLKLGDVIGTSGGECKSYKDNAVYYQITHKGTIINPTWVITRKMTGFEDPIQGNNGVICNDASSSTVTSNVPYVETALQQEGKAYILGASGPDAFDCSGLVQWSMKQHGIDIARDSRGQRKATQRISYEELQRGDLIFRHGAPGDPEGQPDNDDAVQHVMIYLGDGKVIHARDEKLGVMITDFKKTNSHTYGRYAKALGGSTQGSVISSGCQTPGSISTANNGYLWPAPEGGIISSYFGEWRDNHSRQHKGIDIAGKIGGGDPRDKNIPILATVSGTVVSANDTCTIEGQYKNGCGGGWGNYVKIQDSEGRYWIYAHLTKGTVAVTKGQTVSQGQMVGKMGNTGSSKGIHLHFEVRVGGDSQDNAVDPLKFVTKPY